MLKCSGVIMNRILMLLMIGLSLALAQDDNEPYEAYFTDLENSFNYQQGSISFLEDQASIQTGASLRFLDATDAQRLLVDGWGNPPDETTLGMILPADISPFDFEKSWVVEISFDDEGYVSDKEASKMNFDKMLKSMQEGIQESNEAREEAGYEAYELVGWATAPRYDAAGHKLYWAEELNFGDDDYNTLNYNIRVLGRKGYLNLNVIGNMEQLAEIEMQIPNILQAVSFNQGSRYEDFNPTTDRLADYGIATLIAGGIAAKTGLLAKLSILLLGLKKFLVVIVVAVGGLLSRLFGRKSKSEENTSS